MTYRFTEIKNAEQFRSVKSAYATASERDAKHREQGRNGWTSAAKALVSAEGVIVAYTLKQVKRGYPIAKCIEALEYRGLIKALARALWYEKSMKDEFLEVLRSVPEQGEES